MTSVVGLVMEILAILAMIVPLKPRAHPPQDPLLAPAMLGSVETVLCAMMLMNALEGDLATTVPRMPTAPTPLDPLHVLAIVDTMELE